MRLVFTDVQRGQRASSLCFPHLLVLSPVGKLQMLLLVGCAPKCSLLPASKMLISLNHRAKKKKGEKDKTKADGTTGGLAKSTGKEPKVCHVP